MCLLRIYIYCGDSTKPSKFSCVFFWCFFWCVCTCICVFVCCVLAVCLRSHTGEGHCGPKCMDVWKANVMHVASMDDNNKVYNGKRDTAVRHAFEPHHTLQKMRGENTQKKIQHHVHTHKTGPWWRGQGQEGHKVAEAARWGLTHPVGQQMGQSSLAAAHEKQKDHYFWRRIGYGREKRGMPNCHLYGNC